MQGLHYYVSCFKQKNVTFMQKNLKSGSGRKDMMTEVSIHEKTSATWRMYLHTKWHGLAKTNV